MKNAGTEENFPCFKPALNKESKNKQLLAVDLNILHKLVMLMRSLNLKLVWEHTLMNKYQKTKTKNLQFKIERVVYFSYRNMQSRVRVVDLYIKRTKKM